MSRQRVGRWEVGLLATLLLVAVGLLYANATLLAATLIPLAYVLFGTVSSVPDDRRLAVERRIKRASPEPGATVDVRVTVENESERVLPDVRLVDGVPDELVVSEGTPRLCSSLSPGETRTLSYSVVAKRGTYAFEPPVVRFRSLAGSERSTEEIAAAGDDELVCVSALGRTPRQTRTTPHIGTVTADSGGSGLEFHSTRQYRQGDPVNRIDWHHVAKTGEFITVQYREQKTSRTVLILDARAVNRITPRPGYPAAVDRSVYAAERLHETLTDAGIETRVAAVGLDGTSDRVELDPAGVAWAGPDEASAPAMVFEAALRDGARVEHRKPTPPQIGLDTPLSWTDVDGTAPTARTDGGGTTGIVRKIPADARVVLCSPLVDNWPVELCRALAGTHETVVVSPNPTGADRTGQRITAIHRRLRLRELQRVQASAVDWAVEQPFETALREALPLLLSHR